MASASVPSKPLPPLAAVTRVVNRRLKEAPSRILDARAKGYYDWKEIVEKVRVLGAKIIESEKALHKDDKEPYDPMKTQTVSDTTLRAVKDEFLYDPLRDRDDPDQDEVLWTQVPPEPEDLESDILGKVIGEIDAAFRGGSKTVKLKHVLDTEFLTRIPSMMPLLQLALEVSEDGDDPTKKKTTIALGVTLKIPRYCKVDAPTVMFWSQNLKALEAIGQGKPYLLTPFQASICLKHLFQIADASCEEMLRLGDGGLLPDYDCITQLFGAYAKELAVMGYTRDPVWIGQSKPAAGYIGADHWLNYLYHKQKDAVKERAKTDSAVADTVVFGGTTLRDEAAVKAEAKKVASHTHDARDDVKALSATIDLHHKSFLDRLAADVRARETAAEKVGSKRQRRKDGSAGAAAMSIEAASASAAVVDDKAQPLAVHVRQRPWKVADEETGKMEPGFVGVDIGYLITGDVIAAGTKLLDELCDYKALVVPSEKDSVVEAYHLTLGHGFTDAKSLDVANAIIAGAGLTRADIALATPTKLVLVGDPAKSIMVVVKLQVSPRVVAVFDQIYASFSGLSNSKLKPHTTLMYATGATLKGGKSVPERIPDDF